MSDLEDLTIPKSSCRYVMKLPFEERCNFVKHTADCSSTDSSVLNPFLWVFCSNDEVYSAFGIVGVIISLIITFIVTTVIADAFVCPCVAVIVRYLRISDEIAGVTVIALANGFPDLFTAFSGGDLDHPEILFGGMTGATLFDAALVAGFVIFSRPFHINAWPFVRNITFLIITYSILFLGFYTKTFNIYYSLGILIVYCLYITVTFIDSYVTNKYEHSTELVIEDEDEIIRIGREKSIYIPSDDIRFRQSVALQLLVQMERQKIYKEMGFRASHFQRRGNAWRNIKSHLTEFIENLNTSLMEEWNSSNLTEKICMIFEFGIRLILKLIIPSVNTDLPNDGWCKLLIMINMLVFPSFILYCLDYLTNDIVGVPLWSISLTLGILVSTTIFFTTRTYEAPSFHSIFAFFGLIASVFMIHILADLVIIHLQAIGARFNISSSLLSLTFLALGNSLGDLVVNCGLAMQGMQNIGLTACFGSPMFNCSIGLALVSALLDFKGHPLESFYGSLSPVGSLYVYISLISSFVFLTLMNFQARRLFGIYLITTYFTFLVLILLMESIIHPFGTEHFRSSEFKVT